MGKVFVTKQGRTKRTSGQERLGKKLWWVLFNMDFWVQKRYLGFPEQVLSFKGVPGDAHENYLI